MTTIVDEAARATLLKDAAKAAKLKDPALLDIAKRGLSPADAVADLQARYPTAFETEPVKRYGEMSAVERAKFERQHRVANVRGRF